MTLCVLNIGHGELAPREFIHPRWRTVVRAWWCPVCKRAWLLVQGRPVELDLTLWKELADVSL